MSYCVNCGVELGASERRCPLCGVEVINPAAAFDPNAERPYPAKAEKVRHREVRIVAAKVLSLLMAIPVISILAVDLVTDGRLTWSLIPVAAICLVFMSCVFPCLFRRPPVWLFMLFAAIEVILFLFVLNVITGGDWLWLFAVPVTLLCSAAIIGIYLIVASKRASLPLKMIVILLILMVFVIVLQMLIEIHLHGRIRLDWSLYAAISCGLLSLVVLIVWRLYAKNESFRKKLFF